MAGIQVEYVGFTPRPTAREYTLLVKRAGEIYSFTVAIANDAFRSRRARYQDAPDICFLKLQRELAACQSQLPPARLKVTDDDLEAYRAAHAPKPPQRRHRPVLPQP